MKVCDMDVLIGDLGDDPLLQLAKDFKRFLNAFGELPHRVILGSRDYRVVVREMEKLMVVKEPSPKLMDGEVRYSGVLIECIYGQTLARQEN